MTLLKGISQKEMFLFLDMASLEKNKKFFHFPILNSTMAPPYVLSICITVLIVFKTKDPFSKHEIVGYLTEPFITILSMIGTFFICISLKRNTKRYLIEKQVMDVILNFKLIFFWVFGLACIFDSALEMVMDIDSLFLNNGCHLFSTVKCRKVIAISFVEVLFFVGQLGFISLYRKFSFRPSHLINIGASIMIVTHLIRWFLIHFSEVFWRTYDFYFKFDWNATSNTTVQNDCLHFSSIEHLILEVFEYIDSLSIEYNLLSVLLLSKCSLMSLIMTRLQRLQEKTFRKLPFIQKQQTRKLIHWLC